MQNIICIIQARMGSSRLPGKVLLELKPGLTLLEMVTLRLRISKMVSKIVLATTENAEDDLLVIKARDLGIDVVRGSRDNVLSRFAKAVDLFAPDFLVRVCADRPFVSAQLIDFALETLINGNYAYVSNWISQRTWPVGLDTEVFTTKALVEANTFASDKYDLEHVTPYIWSRPHRFPSYSLVSQQDDSDIRLTIDEVADLTMVRSFLSLVPDAEKLEWKKVVSKLRKYPEILAINSQVIQR
jgi:spore coat polysaccharide biosynthesis protein SpsF